MIDPPRETPIDGYISRVEAEARVGRVLRGKWRLDALLGIGGMAAVYSATHRNGMRGAVKLLHPIHGRDGELRRRFLREGYLANRVQHIGAVRVLDDDATDDGGVFLVMELLEGEALIDRAIDRGGTLPVREVMWLGDQLLDALATAHGRGVVHRDLKPDNLFLTHGGILKILDFGLACLLEPITRASAHCAVLMGTPAYMPPEQVDGHWDQVDAQSDTWSVGATLFALASGHHVHNEIARELGEQGAHEHTPSLADVMPEAPAPFVQVVDRALRADKAARWPDARAMQAALRDAHVQMFGAAIPPPGRFPEPARRKSTSAPEIHFSTPVVKPPSARWVAGFAGGGAIGVCIGLFALAAREPRGLALEGAARGASVATTEGPLASHLVPPQAARGRPTVSMSDAATSSSKSVARTQVARSATAISTASGVVVLVSPSVPAAVDVRPSRVKPSSHPAPHAGSASVPPAAPSSSASPSSGPPDLEPIDLFDHRY